MKLAGDITSLILGALMRDTLHDIIVKPVETSVNKYFVLRLPLHAQFFRHYYMGHLGNPLKCSLGLCKLLK